MNELREFTVNILGVPHTLRLNEAEAKRRNLEWDTKKTPTKKTTPANKAKSPENK